MICVCDSWSSACTHNTCTALTRVKSPHDFRSRTPDAIQQAGWNAGAQDARGETSRVARHSSNRRAAAVLNTFIRFRIILTKVESYDRRIQSAINIQWRRMLRRAEFLLTRALRRAG